LQGFGICVLTDDRFAQMYARHRTSPVDKEPDFKRSIEFMRKNRNIGHDWQLTEEQNKLLQKYGDANKLLVNCLNSHCHISSKVKQEIEDTLLLSIVEIEKRKRDK
jgi:predicted NACHT family NTPase